MQNQTHLSSIVIKIRSFFNSLLFKPFNLKMLYNMLVESCFAGILPFLACKFIEICRGSRLYTQEVL